MTESDQQWAEQDSLERMAEFCLATGLAPSVYWGLTQDEYEAFVKVNKKRNKKGA